MPQRSSRLRVWQAAENTLTVVAHLLFVTVLLSLADASGGSDVSVEGGNFTCHATRNGGFLFAQDQARVNITGGWVSNNVADRKGGAVSARRSLAAKLLHTVVRTMLCDKECLRTTSFTRPNQN